MEQGALAKGLFLITFDEAVGRSGLAQDLLAGGLVGAQIADLVTAGLLTVDPQDRVVGVRSGRTAPDHESAILVLDSIAHEPREHTVRAWIDALGGALIDAVRTDLVRDGVLEETTERGLLGRRRTRLSVRDVSAALRPEATLQSMIRSPGTFTLPGAITLVLLSALGVERLLEPGVDRATARTLAEDAATHLPAPIDRLRRGLAETATTAGASVRR